MGTGVVPMINTIECQAYECSGRLLRFEFRSAEDMKIVDDLMGTDDDEARERRMDVVASCDVCPDHILAYRLTPDLIWANRYPWICPEVGCSATLVMTGRRDAASTGEIAAAQCKNRHHVGGNGFLVAEGWVDPVTRNLKRQTTA